MNRRILSYLAHLLCIVVGHSVVNATWGANEASSLKPFLAKHCVECHGPEVSERGLRLDELPADFDTRERAGH